MLNQLGKEKKNHIDLVSKALTSAPDPAEHGNVRPCLRLGVWIQLGGTQSQKMEKKTESYVRAGGTSTASRGLDLALSLSSLIM